MPRPRWSGSSGTVDPSCLPSPLASIAGRFNQQGLNNRTGSAITVVTCSETADPATVAAAAAADLAIVFVGTSSSEFFDRDTLGHGAGQDGMISAIAAAQPQDHRGGDLAWRGADAVVSSILLGLMPG